MSRYDEHNDDVNTANLSAEQSVLGALLTNSDDEGLTVRLTAGMFSADAHQKIYIAIRRLEKDKIGVDIVTVAELLERHGRLAEAGGLGYLAELAQNFIGKSNLKRYVEIVYEKFLTRKVILSASNAIKEVGVGKDIAEIISSLVGSLNSVLEVSATHEPTPISQLLLERFERIEKIQYGELTPIETGFAEFDEKFGGLHAGDLVILAGRPSMGKTALGIQLAEQIQNKTAPALVFSCEMSNGQLVDRVIAGNSRVSSKRLFRKESMTDEDWTNLTATVPKIESINIFLDDRTNSLEEMVAKARAIKRKHGLGLVVIDYLQLMRTNERHSNREQEISAISRGLKAMAKELGVPVIALSQLSRKVEERQDKRPIMSDLRESGAIEQDADIIMFVYRDDYYNQDSQFKGSAEVITAKNRNGDTGKMFLTFEKENTRFIEFKGNYADMERNSTPNRRGYRANPLDD